MGISFHWGAPKYPAIVSSHTNTGKIGRFGSDTWSVTEQHKDHPVRCWYGVSFGHACFIGLMLFDPAEHRTKRYKEPRPAPLSLNAKDDESA